MGKRVKNFIWLAIVFLVFFLFNSVPAYCLLEGIYKENTHDKFSEDPGLKTVKCDNDVTRIEDNAFKKCKALNEIQLSNQITYIGDYAFTKCKALKSIELPCTVKYIGKSAFSGCTSLTSINIPNGVTEIGLGAFSGCTSLQSINIPNSVTKIGDYAFHNCINLKKVYISENVLHNISGNVKNIFLDCRPIYFIVEKSFNNNNNSLDFNKFSPHFIQRANEETEYPMLCSDSKSDNKIRDNSKDIFEIDGRRYLTTDNTGTDGGCLWRILKKYVDECTLKTASSKIGCTFDEFVEMQLLERLLNKINESENYKLAFHIDVFDYSGVYYKFISGFTPPEPHADKTTIVYIALIFDSMSGLGHYVEKLR